MSPEPVLVAKIGVRIESGPGGPETDEWCLDVELGPGITVRDPDGLVLAARMLLAEHQGDVVAALRRLSVRAA